MRIDVAILVAVVAFGRLGSRNAKLSLAFERLRSPNAKLLTLLDFAGRRMQVVVAFGYLESSGSSKVAFCSPIVQREYTEDVGSFGGSKVDFWHKHSRRRTPGTASPLECFCISIWCLTVLGPPKTTKGSDRCGWAGVRRHPLKRKQTGSQCAWGCYFKCA